MLLNLQIKKPSEFVEQLPGLLTSHLYNLTLELFQSPPGESEELKTFPFSDIAAYQGIWPPNGKKTRVGKTELQQVITLNYFQKDHSDKYLSTEDITVDGGLRHFKYLDYSCQGKLNPNKNKNSTTSEGFWPDLKLVCHIAFVPEKFRPKNVRF